MPNARVRFTRETEINGVTYRVGEMLDLEILYNIGGVIYAKIDGKETQLFDERIGDHNVDVIAEITSLSDVLADWNEKTKTLILEQASVPSEIIHLPLSRNDLSNLCLVLGNILKGWPDE